MHDILSGAKLTVGLFVLGRHHQERDSGRIEQFREAHCVRNAGYWHAVELVDRKAKPILDEVFQFSP